MLVELGLQTVFSLLRKTWVLPEGPHFPERRPPHVSTQLWVWRACLGPDMAAPLHLGSTPPLTLLCLCPLVNPFSQAQKMLEGRAFSIAVFPALLSTRLWEERSLR